MGDRIRRFKEASSTDPATFGNMSAMFDPDSPHGGSTHIILRLEDNIRRLLVEIEGPLINQTDSTKALGNLLTWLGWTYCAPDWSEDPIILKLTGEGIAELTEDLQQSYQELRSLIKYQYLESLQS